MARNEEMKRPVPAPAVQAVWMFGQVLLLSAILLSPKALASVPRPGISVPALDARSTGRSALSGILILLSIGCVLLSATLGLMPIHPVWKSFLSVLFVVGLMVGNQPVVGVVLEPALVIDAGTCVERTVFAITVGKTKPQGLNFHVR